MKDPGIFELKEIDTRWNEHMLNIVQDSPIESNGLKIFFDRHPDIFFLPSLMSEKLRCCGFFLRNKLEGFAMMLNRKVFVNGDIKLVPYFGYLVVSRNARGRGFLYKMSDFFFDEYSHPASVGYFIVMHGNTAAIRLLNRFHPKYPRVPYSKLIGYWKVHNRLLFFSCRKNSKYRLRKAQLPDTERIVKLLQDENRNRLFGSVVTKEAIIRYTKFLPGFDVSNFYLAEQENEIVGVCCAWDMSAVKTNRVVEYNRKLRIIRFAFNGLAVLLRYPPLPPKGEPFRNVTITDYAVKNRDPAILKTLLDRIHNDYRKKKYHIMIFGHALNDPLGKAADYIFSVPVISDIHVFSGLKETTEDFESKDYPWIEMLLL